MHSRYHRQMLLPFMGEAGQNKLAKARVILVGCGALGSVIADQLARAGVGRLVLVDRDVVELTNLQRQVLYEESDAKESMPKAMAAAGRLLAINSSIVVEPHIIDVHAGNIESHLPVDLIIDGTDNAETRYLLNDVAVKHGLPWIYGACVGTDGRVMTIRPKITPCLQCIYPDPPAVGDLATCDVAGVLGPAIAVVAGHQAVAAIKILSGHVEATDGNLLTLDFWKGRYHSIDTGGLRPDCECCGLERFHYLNRPVEASAATLCGRNSVQVRPATAARIDLASLGDRMGSFSKVESSKFLLRSTPYEAPEITLTVFADGRCIVQGTTDAGRARSLVSQYVGT